MDQATTSTETSTVSDPATATVTSLDARMSDVLAEFGTSSEEADTSTADTSDGAAAAKPKTDAVGVDDEARATRAKERKANLDELRAKDQAKPAAKQQREGTEVAATRQAELEKELAEVKARASRLDRLKDPNGVIQTLKEEGVDPAVLAEFLRSGGDPAELAAKRARSELSPEFEAIKKQQDADRAELAALKAERAQERAEYTRTEAINSLHASLDETKDDFPRTARFRELIGRDALVGLATSIGQSLPEGASFEQLLQLTEEYFETLAPVFQAAAQSTTKSPKTLATAKAPALTNRIAASNSVVDDEDSPQSLDERARAVISGLRASRDA